MFARRAGGLGGEIQISCICISGGWVHSIPQFVSQSQLIYIVCITDIAARGCYCVAKIAFY